MNARKAPMSTKWTIDAIAHALPHPELRATFLREATFSEIGLLPAVLQRWRRLAEAFEAGRSQLTRLVEYFDEHGRLPAEYEAESPEGVAMYEQWKNRLEGQGAS
ncbi:hypothetical protein [Streptomyces litchfieldiae]|uniref:Uncharacterized protein n=1 Tax=Streptomyces litchfieldiae TaxID=3075543 RepID=A0ABU2MZH3_9ACTN|nr:hypothetical protein [Streptomyces sp. DSM 44938]MDT0345909.1 hypothetical protein [Streptomyces sp. DSM 44938]